MTKMLERAARAAWRLTCLGLKETEVEAVWNNQDTKEKLMFVALARAVLLAVRELPDEIIDEHLYDNEYGYAMYYEGWQPAIDAILSEKQP